MKKIIYRRNFMYASACILSLACVLCFVGCEIKESNTLVYEHKDLIVQNMYDSVSLESDGTLRGQNVCIIPKDTPNVEDNNIQAPVALLINRTDNKVLFTKNIYKKMYPASLTKAMSALAAYTFSDNMAEFCTISKNAASITESGAKLCGFKEGDVIKFYDLVASMMVYSGNDAALAVGEKISNTEEQFCSDMTSLALRNGATASNFVNPHGLHNDNHFTTAYDMYLIMNKLLENKESYSVIGLKNHTFSYKDKAGNKKSADFTTTNKYITGAVSAPDNVKVLGGKTGTTNKAGNCLILVSKDEKNKEYISVILNASTSSQLYSEMTHLLKYIHK